MVKWCNETVLHKPYYLFNKTHNLECYPETWKNSLIFSIYKLSNKDNSKTYWGITLSNCLRKLFNKILYNRLGHNIGNKIFISKVQAEF